MKKISLFLSMAILAGAFSGCVVALGNKDTLPGKGDRATLGQQLLDLKKARDEGAMTDAEYNTQKAKLLHESHK